MPSDGVVAQGQGTEAFPVLGKPPVNPGDSDSSPDRVGFRNPGCRIGAPDSGSDHDSRNPNLTDWGPLSRTGAARGFFLFYPCGDSQEPEHLGARLDLDRDELFSRGESTLADHGSGVCPGGPSGKAAAGGNSFLGSGQSQGDCVLSRETSPSGKVYGSAGSKAAVPSTLPQPKEGTS